MNITGNSPVIAAIVAVAEDRVIGNNNQLLWRLPADLEHFKSITMGHPIIMGRKTFDSIGKPLPGRINIVLTRNADFNVPGVEKFTSVDDAIQFASEKDNKEIFIIGGAEIYQQTLAQIDRIYVTIVHHEFKGDVLFPEIDKKEWKITSREDHEADEANPYRYSFLTMERKE